MTTVAPSTRAVVAFAAAMMCLLFVAPIVIAFARGAVGKTEVAILTLLLGWTGFAWVWALVLAVGPRRPRPAPMPQPPPPPAVMESVYRDGVYLVSTGPDTHTWAIRENGTWNIVYEIEGEERLTGRVREHDVPISVLAAALEPGDRS
jgi:hypothetical protein